MKLHLGCGNKHIDGYVNIDIRYLPGVDEVNNVGKLRNYKKESVDVIYASHVLEHFSRWEYMFVLHRWYELLKPNGILRLGVPDFNEIVNYYLKTKDLRGISGILYGGQDYSENNHYWVWDFETITKELKDIGFKKVYKYDWRSTEHSHIDDYTQSYLPHMDKENGTLLSLNIEAIK
jgi:predicted SAM-dependent methyltransferase